MSASKLQKVMEYKQKCILLSIEIGLDAIPFIGLANIGFVRIPIDYHSFCMHVYVCVSFFSSQLANCRRMFRMKLILVSQYTLQ